MLSPEQVKCIGRALNSTSDYIKYEVEWGYDGTLRIRARLYVGQEHVSMREGWWFGRQTTNIDVHMQEFGCEMLVFENVLQHMGFARFIDHISTDVRLRLTSSLVKAVDVTGLNSDWIAATDPWAVEVGDGPIMPFAYDDIELGEEASLPYIVEDVPIEED